MKNRTEENRRNLEMIAPTWTMLGLALTACGGGGGGGSSSGRVTPATQFGVGGSLSATTDETNEIEQFDALRWDTAIAVLDITGTFDLQVTSETVTLSATSFGSTTTASWTITGADAADFIFVRDGAENAVLQTVHPVDYENPRDANRDNVYEITLDAQGGTFAGLTHILSTGDVDYTITVRNNPADDRSFLSFISTSEDIVEPAVDPNTYDLSTTIEETNDIVQFFAVRWDVTRAIIDSIGTTGLGPGVPITSELQVTQKTVTLITRSLSTTTTSWTITGDDADEFIFVEHGEGAILQTVNPVDYENPRDANGDNVYEITLDTGASPPSIIGVDNILPSGDVDYTITVTDNPNLDMI